MVTGKQDDSGSSDITQTNPPKAIHPVYTVTNIQNKVRILDGTKVTYTSWVRLFKLHARGYKVLSHIDDTTAPPAENDPAYEAWSEIDAIVLQWIYGTLSDELLVRVLDETTALGAWNKVKEIFLNNKGSRAAALEQEFNNLNLRSMSSLEAYCQRLKDLASQLQDVECPVAPNRLVLQLVRGLPPEFDTVAAYINQTLPPWDTAYSMLQLELQRQRARDANSPSEVAATMDHDPPTHSNPRRDTPPNRSRQSQPRNNQQRRNNQQQNRPPNQPSSNRRNPTGQQRPQWPAYQPPYWPAPWWASPPPCPYPTQAGWAPPPWTNNSAPPKQPPQQANLAEVNPMEPSELEAAFSAMTLNPQDDQWYMDSGATSHLTADAGKLTNHCVSSIKSVFVGNGKQVPVLGSGNTTLPHPNKPLSLHNVLHTPNVIKNLVSVRKFCRDNFVSVEFDPLGFSIKELKTGKHLTRHNSDGDLYPFTNPTPASAFSFSMSTSSPIWHSRLGHPGNHVMDCLTFNKNLSCNKIDKSFVCNSCQIAKHKRLPFHTSTSNSIKPFDLVHADLWTSPIPSNTSFKYYLILIDDYTHYTWVFPIKYKSETFDKLKTFHKLIQTQFQTSLKTFQCDKGGEFDNHQFHNFASSTGLQIRFSCPHTSQQNGTAERMIRRLNELMLTLLTHASLPPTYWVDALHTATYLHNILPTTTLKNRTPTSVLYLKNPTYDHLRTFGCACYPNLNATRPHKLAPRSKPCVFLGYPPQYRGYRCLDLSTGKVILSRHVTFDESSFPFTKLSSTPPTYPFQNDEPTPLLFEPTATDQPNPTPTTPTTPTTQQTIPPVTPYPITYSRRPRQPPLPPAPVLPPHPPAPATTSRHPMQTRLKTGSTTPKTYYNLTTTTSSISPIPKSHNQALSDPNWTCAMTDEYKALMDNNTWELVPRPPDALIIRCMWLFRHKFHANGTLARYKARLVINGKSQQVGVDCDETFSPVVKPTTIRTVLSLAVSRSWPIHQLDVKNAFLHGDLQETVYMFQPPGFVNSQNPKHVCRLNKSLYGLKQAPRAWYHRFATFVHTCGFKSTTSDSSLFVYHHNNTTAYLLLYVDDILLTASDTNTLRYFIDLLSKEFSMSDLGSLHHFLGIDVKQLNGSLFLTQEQYVRDILHRANMQDCKPCATPVDTDGKLSATAGNPFHDGSLYRSLAGALQYLTFTRPDIAYAVQQVCLFMHAPREPHFNFLKRILRYLKGTTSHGLHITPSKSNKLTAYSDADWGGCPDSRRSTSGYCVFLGDNLISWSSKRQPTISRSSAEAEYKGVANATAETTWLRNLLLELHLPLRQATIIYCDNISAVYLAKNPVQHQRTKHIEIDIHFVREKVRIGALRVLHVPSDYQYADIFTKGLPRPLFTRFRSSLSIRPATDSTAGEY